MIAEQTLLGSSTTGLQITTAGAISDLDGNVVIADIVDLNTNLIQNIGNAGTDFSATGGLTLADNLTVTAGGVTITAGALAVNSDSITSDGSLIINATTTDIGTP